MLYPGGSKMLKVIFPFLSLTDAPDIRVGGSAPRPTSWGGRSGSAQAVAPHYTVSPIPNSPLPPGRALPALPLGCSRPGRFHRELSRFAKKAGE